MAHEYMRYKILASGFAICVGQLGLTANAFAAIPSAEYDDAIQAARAGSTAPTIKKLRVWHAAYPADQKILHDLIVVLGWAGDFKSALVHGDQLAPSSIPPYVLKSLAHSAGSVGRWADAEKWQRQVLRETPKDIEARTGLVSALFAQQRSAEALQYVQSLLPKFSSAYQVSDVPTIMLLGSVHARRTEQLAAANAYQEVLRLDPQSRDAFRAYVFALNAGGMPYLAARTADRRLDLFSVEEQRLIAHTAAALTVNFGEAQMAVDHKQARFATTDVALAENAEVSRRFGEQPITGFDRMIALRDRQRMTEVTQLYQSFLASGVAVPSYAKSASADAYLYLEQPEMARDLYLSAIADVSAAGGPKVDAWHVGLAYAYSEAEQHSDAQFVADQLATSTPAFVNQGAPSVELPNDDYSTATVLAALVRMYADRLDAAESRIAALREVAPFNAQIRSAWADLQMSRGHPRAALEEYSLLQVDEPKSVAAQIGRGNALLALNQFTEAKQVLPALQADYPENKGVQRLAQQLDIYDRPLLQISSTFGKGGGIAGAESVVDAQLHSAPLSNSLGDAFRVFSHVSHARGQVDDGPGNETNVLRTRAGLGLDYRTRDMTAAVEGNRAVQNAQRSGIALSLDKDFSDAWHLRLNADSNVNDLSAAAFNQDITARRLSAGMTWKKNESRSVDAEISNMRFSDNNRRDAAALAWTERWLSGPAIKLDSKLALATSRNSLRDAVYFNPSRDHEATLTVSADWTTWRRYQRSMTQSFQVHGGRYWQKGYDAGATTGAQYGHLWAFDSAFTLAYGIGVSTHPYDGVREKRNYGYLNLNWAIK